MVVNSVATNDDAKLNHEAINSWQQSLAFPFLSTNLNEKPDEIG